MRQGKNVRIAILDSYTKLFKFSVNLNIINNVNGFS